MVKTTIVKEVPVDKEISPKEETIVRPIPSTDIDAPIEVEQENQDEDNKLEISNKRIFIIGSIIASLILVSTGAVFFMYTRQPQEEKVIVKDQDKTQKKEVAKPTKSELNRSEISFEVLNGSGVAGEGKKAADKITGLEYDVSNVGNADNYDYAESELWLKKEFEDKADLVLADLKKEFKNVSYSGELTDSAATARLVLGKDDVE